MLPLFCLFAICECYGRKRRRRRNGAASLSRKMTGGARRARQLGATTTSGRLSKTKIPALQRSGSSTLKKKAAPAPLLPPTQTPDSAGVAALPDRRASIGADAYCGDGMHSGGAGRGAFRHHGARRRHGGAPASRSLCATRARSTRRTSQRPRRGISSCALLSFFLDICKVRAGLAAIETSPPARTEQVKDGKSASAH